MHKQLYQLVEDYQKSGEVGELMTWAYELLRFTPTFGKAAMTCRAAWYYLLPDRLNDESQTEAYKDFKAKLEEASGCLEEMGIHPAGIHSFAFFPYAFIDFAFFPHAFIKGEVCTIYGWHGNRLYAANGQINAEDKIEQVGDHDDCKAMALPFVALVKAILVLALEAVEAHRKED